MMFLLTPSVLTTSLLTVVLTVVVGSEYYSRLPGAEDKHLYEYGSDTNDTIQTGVDDDRFNVQLTHPIVFFGRSYSSFEVSNSHCPTLSMSALALVVGLYLLYVLSALGHLIDILRYINVLILFIKNKILNS